MENFGEGEGDEFTKHLNSLTSAPVRHWYLNNDKTSLIQIQKDRFIQNWRKREGEQDYPNFENVINPFKDNFSTFETSLRDWEIGTIEPNQCEVTYINHIPSGIGWSDFSDIGELISLISPNEKGDFLPEIEQVELNSSFIIADGAGRSIGRLHVHMKPWVRKTDGQEGILLELTARGKPKSADFTGVLARVPQGLGPVEKPGFP